MEVAPGFLRSLNQWQNPTVTTCAPMVIEAIKLDGLKKSEASELFNISRNTIDLWLKRLSETGDYQAKPNQPPGNGHLYYRLGGVP